MPGSSTRVSLASCMDHTPAAAGLADEPPSISTPGRRAAQRGRTGETAAGLPLARSASPPLFRYQFFLHKVPHFAALSPAPLFGPHGPACAFEALLCIARAQRHRRIATRGTESLRQGTLRTLAA